MVVRPRGPHVRKGLSHGRSARRARLADHRGTERAWHGLLGALGGRVPLEGTGCSVRVVEVRRGVGSIFGAREGLVFRGRDAYAVRGDVCRGGEVTRSASASELGALATVGGGVGDYTWL